MHHYRATAVALPNYKKRILLTREFQTVKKDLAAAKVKAQRERLRPPDANNGTEALQCCIKQHRSVRSACQICQSLLIG